MCGNTLIESSNMARSFLENRRNQNYSHCPLKKRPLAYFLQEDSSEAENTPVVTSATEEPENLSLKPQDRFAVAERDQRKLRSLLEAVELCSPPPAHQTVKCWSAAQPPVAEKKSAAATWEPLSVNSSQESALYGLSHTSVSGVPYHHPAAYPAYLPFNFPFSSYVVQPGVPHYPVTPLRQSPGRHEQLSPFAPHDSHSPPHHSSAISSIPRVFSAADPECAASVKHSDSSDVEDLSSPTMSPDSESSTSAKRRRVSTARFQCPDCQKSYSTYCGLTKHQELHCAQQSKKSFSCKHCDKVYVSLGALKMHIRTHTLPCKCAMCGKAFSRPWLLQGHIRTHTGEKPFSCQHCSRSFADRSNLRAHLQTHSDVKRYSCKGCEKTFSRMSLLTKHEVGGCPQLTAAGTTQREVA